MDVNQVRFGEYYIGTSNGRNANRERKAEKEEQAQNYVQYQNNNDNDRTLIDSLTASGNQNIAFISIATSEEALIANAIKNLGQERADAIEKAMMAEFDNGVNQVADIIEAEFPNMFAPDVKNSMAARIFAAE